jgi:PPOX class probable F420-dependent enzyme
VYGASVVRDAWVRLAVAPVARLGTVGPDGSPRLVPCCLAVDELVAYSAVDDKPKGSIRLRRLADVAERPLATLLVDRYDDDWTRLWWVRAGGSARELGDGDGDDDGGERDRAVRLLLAKYPQYESHELNGPVLAIQLERWRSWSAR